MGGMGEGGDVIEWRERGHRRKDLPGKSERDRERERTGRSVIQRVINEEERQIV